MANLEKNRPGWMREKMGFDAVFTYGMGLLAFFTMKQAVNINAAAAALTKLAAASEQAGARAAAAAANYPLAAIKLAPTVLPLTLVIIATGFVPLALVMAWMKWTPELFAPKDALESELTPPNRPESGETSDANEERTSKDGYTRRDRDDKPKKKPATDTGTDKTDIDEKGASEKY